MGLSVLVVGDFRFPGGTSAATEHEIRAMHAAGHQISVLHVDSHVFGSDRGLHPALEELIERGAVRPAQPEDDLNVDVVICHNPLVFEIARLPTLNIQARTRVLVAHQTPCDVAGRLYYDPWRVARRIETHFGGPFVWAPISPICRASFARVGFAGPLLAEDWRNTLFAAEWQCDRERPLAAVPIIGRHGRAGLEKWPASRAEVLQVYPNDPHIRVRLLGAEGDFLKLMGNHLPANWEALPFGAVPAAEFLKTIDFFVYYHHPRWVEAFGRAVAEAAASGAVAILPPHFEPTFGEAALYAPPERALDLVRALHVDWPRYLEQSERGRSWIRDQHGPERFLALLSQVAMGKAELLRSHSASASSVIRAGAQRRTSILSRMAYALGLRLLSRARRLGSKGLAKVGLLPARKRLIVR